MGEGKDGCRDPERRLSRECLGTRHGISGIIKS